MQDTKSEKWIVTGGAGFLGSFVVDQLVEQGHTVLSIDNLSWGKKEHFEQHLTSSNFEHSASDIRDHEKMRELAHSFAPDHVVHLAALHYIPQAIREPELTIDINVKGTQSLLSAIQGLPLKSFFLASTGDVYQITDQPMTEDSTPIAPHNIYGLSKWMSEQLMDLYHTDKETQFIKGRLFNLIGPRETNPHIVPEIISQLQQHKDHLNLGNISPIRDFVPVDQAASSIIKLCQTQLSEYVVNIATGQGQSVAQLIEVIQSQLGHTIDVRKDPERVRATDRPKLVAQTARIKALIGSAPSGDPHHILGELLKTANLL